MNLEDNEIELLCNALDSLERSDAHSTTMSMMIAASVCPSREQYEKLEAEILRKEKEAKAAQSVRRERIILLKAKLIQIKQSNVAEKFSAAQ